MRLRCYVNGGLLGGRNYVTFALHVRRRKPACLSSVCNLGTLNAGPPPRAVASSIKGLFDTIEAHKIIDFIKETRFYKQL